ncbi:hypothetical protein BDW59DRAFT_167025 [Aspergillus cavernicola]|uniref:Uncharacterized protein n=1 Tax=Aspergillus cavernicola TaxID=176166 RepID=A0ABR4HHC8_9EURO
MPETITTAPYNHEVYHLATKPSLRTATDTFVSRNAQHFINTLIRDCFLKHNVQKAFSACLLHRHFDLNQYERNIEEDSQAAASTNLDDIHACSWLFHDGKLFPYEFKRGDVLPTPPADFVTELGLILQTNSLCDIIGLQTYQDGIVEMEKTDHAARISTTTSYPEGAEEVKQPKASISSFAFF